MNDDRPDETSPLLPGEFLRWKDMIWHETRDPEFRGRITHLFDAHWANGLTDLPYYVDRMFERMWGHYDDPREGL